MGGGTIRDGEEEEEEQNTYLYIDITEHHLPQIGEYLYLPDRLVNKQFPSLVKALGCMVKIKDRCILIKLSNGQLVWRHASDLVSFNLARTDKQNIDVLDLPLKGHPNSEPLWLSESEFNLWLLTINLSAVQYSKPLTLSQVDNGDLTISHLRGCDKLTKHNVNNDKDTDNIDDKENNIHTVLDCNADNNITNTPCSHVTHRWPKWKRKQSDRYGDYMSY